MRMLVTQQRVSIGIYFATTLLALTHAYVPGHCYQMPRVLVTLYVNPSSSNVLSSTIRTTTTKRVIQSVNAGFASTTAAARISKRTIWKQITLMNTKKEIHSVSYKFQLNLNSVIGEYS